MRSLILSILCLAVPFIVMAQQHRSIEIDVQSFAPVQQGALVRVAIDKISPDPSKRPCARIKMHINRMKREEIAELNVITTGGIAVTKRIVAAEGNGLIIELTAKPETRFYLHHDKYGDSNEVNLALEGNKEYRLNAELSVQQSIIINGGVGGAEIYLDGEYKGITNSAAELTVEGITMGSHKVRVVHGSAVTERDIEVTTTSIHFRVEVNTAQSQPQWVIMTISPAQALVTIGDRVYTPDAQGNIADMFANGTHYFTITANDYHTYSDSFVVQGKKLSLPITLKPAYGWLSIPNTGLLSGATIVVDGKNIGTTPITNYKLASGSHTLHVVKDMYKPFEQSITIADNTPLTLTPTLLPNYANVTLDAGVDCTIYANDRLLGQSPWSGKLTAGSYIFEARKDGHESGTTTQSITNEPQSQRYTIPAPKPIYGSLTVTSSPMMARVLVDGKEIGTTPLTENVLIGKHKLSIILDGYTTYEKEIAVSKGGSEEINVPLKVKSIAPVAQASNSSGNARKKAYNVGDYYNDGTKQGVVFYVDATGKHGKIVSIDQVYKQWCSDAQYDKSSVVGAWSKSDGKANTDKVMSRSDKAAYYAFVWCRAKGKDWYLPAFDELKLLYSVRDTINRTLNERGGNTLSGWYWSSTEYENNKMFHARLVFMYDGSAGSLTKRGYYYVRAVSAF
ncbi:MAG: PEGA domain-containing protein [Alistipes sp.]|nr:PEGA domain-containing protein [Alistipes sp.]